MQHLFAAIFQIAPEVSQQAPYSNAGTIWHHMSDALFQSLNRVLSLLIAMLPGVLAFFVALFLFGLLGLAISAVVRRVLVATRFDERMVRNRTNADWAPSTPPTEIAARASFWALLLLGLIIGVSAFDASYATGTTLPISLLPYLTNVVGAIFLLIAGNIIARFLARTVLIGAVNTQLQYARFLSLGVKWLVLVLTAAMVLDHLQIGGKIVELAFGILFGGIVLTLALAIGLGSRDLVSRSIESRIERERPSVTPSPTPVESIRHF